MRLSQAQRLAALMRQFEKSIRKLHSVQHRISALILSTGDLALCEDTLDAIVAMLTEATTTLTLMQSDVLATREAADNGVGLDSKECDD